jgi:predicted CDP-diglyceride synthetase/phosphatidate cytidylyltransferase
MEVWLSELRTIDRVLAGAVLTALAVALATRRRGGRFRRLLGWSGFWASFAVLLASLSKLPAWFSLTLLGLMMYAGLRTYFFVAPMRSRDRFAILGAYLSIPLALWPGYTGSAEAFLATVPIVLFLIFPVLLVVGCPHEGMLDSLGRLLLGVLVFVFCAAHLGLLARSELLVLYGVLALAAELPQRLVGRPGPGTWWGRPALGFAASAVLAVAVGFWVGPSCGLVEEDAGRAGFLVAVGVSMGAAVNGAILRDLTLSAQELYGRGAFLDRVVPPLYAAPFFFHYLNHFA